ncbi:MAG: TIR domain-containing protein [bacterium]|nr:TIR domain-containing protein [bacterium]
MTRGSTSGKGRQRYDLFLAHGSGDKPLVRELYEALLGEGLSVFLDTEELVPGGVWRPALEEALAASQCIALCVGPAGPGPWTELEVNYALRRNREDPSFPVIPIMMPGGDRARLEELSAFLPDFHVVDLTAGILGGSGFSKLTGMLEQAPTGTGHARRSAHDLPIGDVEEGLRRLQDRFAASLRPFLAGGQQIERQETLQVLKHLENDEVRIVVVHGVAGCGKSGVLLGLADDLVELGRSFLPLRLDRHSLKGTPRRFAATELLLPGSPGRCLARVGGNKRGGILLLDQLDALRWTGAHSSEAWDVCREMILDTLSASPAAKIVVCCRTFDLEHDPQIRSWKEQSKNLREVRVSDLADDQVQAAVERAASSKGETRKIDDRELELLRHVHHLQMWLTLYPKLGPRGSLGTRRALMEAFWQDRRTELTKRALTPDRIESIEARLVDEMQEGARLTASIGALNLSSVESEAYLSLQILHLDPAHNLVSFCHQTYLDYLVALRIVGQLAQGAQSLLTWLGAKAEQSLFRREQLRLVLEELRGRDADAYLVQLRTLLEAGEETRFHLRLLCLQFISQLGEPSSAEKQLVLELLDDAYWHEHVLGDVVRGQVTWFEVLDDAGVFERWLAGDDSKLRDSALEMLLYVVEDSGDRVARLLRPYLGEDADWNHRILWVLRFDPAEDTDALFDLRLELTQQGADTADHIKWDELAEKHPMRFLSLVCHLLLTLARSLLEGRRRRRPGRMNELDWYSFEKVTPALVPAELRLPAWELLFKAVMAVAQIRQFQSEEDHVLEPYAVEFGTLEPVTDLLRDLGRILLEENWAAFTSLGEGLAQGDRRKEILFLDCLRVGPANPDLADWALGWLMADPWRARLRMRRATGEWRLAGMLIEAYSPACSEETLRRLEKWLLDYCEPDLLEVYQRRHDWIKKGGNLKVPSPFGRTTHALLPKLPPDRASAAVAKRTAELNRKFGVPQVSSLDDGGGVKAGFVGSPLGPEVLKRMSDRALLTLVASDKLKGGPGADRSKWKGDHFEEASPETIASDFQAATQREPERFGRLLTRWSSDGHPAFLRAILAGLAFPGDRKPDEETWKPPSHELLEDILAVPVVQALAQNEQDTQVGENLCDFLQRYPKYPWSDAALDFVVWVAQHHPHPSPDYYPVGSVGQDSDDFNHLENNALNVTRGRAAYAIRSLLFQHPEFFAKLRPAIESLIRDSHPAVNVAALGACLPVINIDKDQAVVWFLEASAGPDEVLATRDAGAFLRYCYRTHLSRLLPTLDRMVASSARGVAIAGARCVAAAFLVSGEIAERFEQCIDGTPEQRKGIAQVAASLIGEGEFAEKAKATLLRLAEDTDDGVAQAVAKSFRQLDLQHIESGREAWNRFARSKAFQADPTPLLRALERQSGDLLPFADCLLAVGTTFAEELAEAARDHARGLRTDAAHFLLPLLLRLYEQAKDRDQAVYLRCLDLWDRLLERRVGSAMGLTREMDRL